MAKIMTVRPPENLHLWLKDAACEMGIPLNSLILKILWEWVKQEKQQENETTKKEEKYVNQRTRTDDSPPAGGFERGNPKAGG